MSLLSFPFAQAGLDTEDPTIGFYWIRKAIGQGGRKKCSDERFAQFLTELIEGHGFPRPLPHPRHGGGVETGVTHRSEWLRAGVLDWLGDFLPPGAAAAIDAEAEAQAAADMDAAAERFVPRVVGGTAA